MTGEFALKLGTMELSALEELANVVTGRASMKLEENGYPCVISPPEVLLGAGSFVAARPWAFMQVPFSLESGTLAISLALRHE